jgi:plasmid maintenance system killer protein
VIESYGNAEAQRVFEDGKAKKLPVELLKRAIQLLDIMDNVDSLKDLRSKAFPRDVRLHPLKGEMKGRNAIDIHKIAGWRITFEFDDNKFKRVVIENYHKG